MASVSRRLLTALGSLLVAVVMVMGTATPAQADDPDDYPTWQDVQQAKHNEADKKKELGRIESLKEGLQNEVDEAQAEAKQRGQELQDAQMAFDIADQRARSLQSDADDARDEADEAIEKAGRFAAQLYRTGGTNMTASLIMASGSSADGPEQLLADLGSMSRLVEHNTTIYDKAMALSNTAKSLAAQADSAKKVREQKKAEAQDAFAAAQQASRDAQEALAKNQEQISTLEAQYDALKDDTATTVAAYEKGEEIRRKKREEERRKKEEAERKAREEAAKQGGGYVGDQGWAIPVRGWITDGYGPRSCAGCAPVHQGTDLATGAYGVVIHAAHAGTVSYANWYGTYGKLLILDHPDGYQTYYAHTGSYLVSPGEHVEAGQPVARVGNTGLTTGPHLHFEVRHNGYSQDPVPFMRDHGVPLGRG